MSLTMFYIFIHFIFLFGCNFKANFNSEEYKTFILQMCQLLSFSLWKLKNDIVSYGNQMHINKFGKDDRCNGNKFEVKRKHNC